eukprot:TRINITY_DN7265_c0_g1_i1.p1 TRINITY_DN7265_c0_g1~~TRINITY_DN7265_c0_g1_i1.p1  ORF type:complete len:421 (-),score=37.87 TRINITY_DN7265_c0_g1_i1:98-1360(-)
MADKALRKRGKGTKGNSVPDPNKHGTLVNAPDSAGGQSFMKKLLRRIVVGVCLVSILWWVVMSNHIYICGLVLLIQVMCYREIVTLRYNQPEARKRKVRWFRTLNYYYLFASLFYFYLPPLLTQVQDIFPAKVHELLTHYHLYISFSLYILGFCGFVLSLSKGHYKYQFTQMAWTIMTLLLVFGQTAVFIWNIFDGLIWFILPVALIVWNDIAAYFSGVLLGRKIIKKQFLALSPNKTWEGFIGAAIFTMIFGWLFADFLGQFSYFTCPKTNFGNTEMECIPDPIFTADHFELPQLFLSYTKELFGLSLSPIVHIAPIKLHGLFLAIFASLIAPFGGFLASGMKRAFGIKDFDNIFPGHGGMTDRMDCQMVMGLATYVHIHTFIKTASASAAAILTSIYLLPRCDQEEILSQLQQHLEQH